MEIFVIHGDYSKKSYQRFSEYLDRARKRKWEIVNYSGDSVLRFEEVFSVGNLFSSKQLFVVEEPQKLSKKEIDWFLETAEKIKGYVIFYSKGKINLGLISKIAKVKKIEEFKLPKNIFDFLDSFYPKNAKNCVSLLHQILETENIEFIFFLLSKHVRDLFWVKTSPSDIPYPSWRVAKLEKQSSKFSETLLREIIFELSEIDIMVKTSNASLPDSLDLLLIGKLE